MFKVDEYVVYKKNVCRVKEIRTKYFDNTDYYILCPLEDSSLTISLPITTDPKDLRKVMSKEEVETLINKISGINEIDNVNERFIHNEYKELIKSGNHEDLIRIIKTAYLRNDVKINNGKKTGATDENYLKLAEQALYNEISIILGLSYNETKKYVQKKVEEFDKNNK